MNYFGELDYFYYGKWQGMSILGKVWFVVKAVCVPWWVVYRLMADHGQFNIALERKLFYAAHHEQDLRDVDEMLRQLVPGYTHHQQLAPCIAVRNAILAARSAQPLAEQK